MIGAESIASELMGSKTSTGTSVAAAEVGPGNFARLRAVATGLLPRFFDRVVRQAFGDLALDDTPAARYLAELLTRFARAEALRAVQAVAERKLDSVVDSLLAIQTAWDVGSPGFDPKSEEVLRRHIGDYTMFMTGIFRDHVERMGIVGYYELEGRRAYRFVSETARTGHHGDAPLFRRLADRFEQYAGALTYARKVYFRTDASNPEAWPGDPFSQVFTTR